MHDQPLVDQPLVANRFVRMSDASAVDLATGARVTLTIASAGGVSEQTRWAVRCDTLRAWRHPSIARLLDFGAIGQTQRFEAWHCGAPWNGQPAAAALARERAASCLRACGLSVGNCPADAVRTSPYGPVLLPAFDTGYAVAIGELPALRSIRSSAMAYIDRPSLAAIAELFDPTADCRPRSVSLWGSEGAGKSTAIAELARAARRQGLVPIAITLLGSPLAASAEDCTLLIINDERVDDGWRALVGSVMRSSRPHVLLTAGIEEAPGTQGVALEALSTDRLIASVKPAPTAPAQLERVSRAAALAEGLPGRFALKLWGRPSGARTAIGRSPYRTFSLRVAEQPAVYGVDEELASFDAGTPSSTLSTVWSAPGDLFALQRRMDSAVRLLAAGRHAPGDRAMRQAIGGFVRRADWTQAARGAKALAESLLLRGRTLDARAAIDDARSYGEKGGHDGTLVDLALLAGHAWIDLIRLDEAEGVLSAAMDAAATRADRAQVAEASLAMARCLFWRGRYADADAVLASCSAGSTDRTAVRVAIAASRQAVGRRDLGRAVAAAAEAIARAAAAGAPDLQADAACAAAFAHLAVSDLEAVERDVAAGVTHARAARRPVCAIRARVLLVEAERRRGRPSVAAALLHRLTRIAPSSLPPIVWARCSLLADTLKPDASIAAIVARHTRGSGLMGLALLLPDVSARAQPADFDGFVDGLVGILHACQNADEETAVLVDVCGRLRQQLHAAAVAVVRVHGPHVDIIAHDGARLDPAVAHRAIDAGITIAPHRAEDRIEAAAPIRYGGATIAAMAARWPIATTQPLAGAPTVLTMAAAAVAPAVAAAIARASAPARPGPAELLGVSAAMADVRRSVERAAAAPFCVLIEGESGCGKELVARAVHRCSPRRDRAFCTLNCAALPDDLVESELFGHAKGAFTGAVGERPGVFEEAHGGTLFLDEIGELSLRAQAKVLRVIQEGELRRVGENLARRVDVRILSATNRDLRQDVAAGRFRLDLLYRLDVLRIAIPPLRDRREDIAGLVEHFWSDAARRVGSRATLSSATVAVLARYGWPGNVRELQNVLAALAVRTPKRGVVSPAALAPPFGHHEAAESWRLDEARRTFETRFVRAALVRTGGHRARAAIELGVSRQGLAKLMLRLGISESPSAQS